jgi:glucose-6-phosphate isomerase
VFRNNPERFQKFSVHLKLEHGSELLLDYSKNRIRQEVLVALYDLARSTQVEEARNALLDGDEIYPEDERPSIHLAWRTWPQHKCMFSRGLEVTPEVNAIADRMAEIVTEVVDGQWLGYTGKKISHVVNIASGGAHVGPNMAAEALYTYQTGPSVIFVSNVDGAQLSTVLKDCNPETTLFVLAGVDFMAPEEVLNADSAKDWLLSTAFSTSAVPKHFIAVTNQKDEAIKFGVDEKYVLTLGPFQRKYALFSPLAISLVMSIGIKNYQMFLHGAFSMDQHFKTAPMYENIPILMALIGIWYNNFFEAESYAIIPYNQVLHKFPGFIRHLEMESNGKNLTCNGDPVDYHTAPVVWGKPGTDSQHVFHQLLVQGTRFVPCDFLAGVVSNCPEEKDLKHHHDLLLSNYVAQLEALMRGKSLDIATAELEKSGKHFIDVKRLRPFKVFQGSRPNTAIVVSRFTPHTLGAIVAMYEHKVFVQGVVWNVDTSQRYGAQAGTKLSRRIAEVLRGGPKTEQFSSSTTGLIDFINKHKKSL